MGGNSTTTTAIQATKCCTYKDKVFWPGVLWLGPWVVLFVFVVAVGLFIASRLQRQHYCQSVRNILKAQWKHTSLIPELPEFPLAFHPQKMDGYRGCRCGCGGWCYVGVFPHFKCQFCRGGHKMADFPHSQWWRKKGNTFKMIIMLLNFQVCSTTILFLFYIYFVWNTLFIVSPCFQPMRVCIATAIYINLPFFMLCPGTRNLCLCAGES